MAFTKNDLEKIAELAYLTSKAEHTEHLANDIKAIMTFVDCLCTVETNDVAPLFHPLDLQQRLRADVVSEKDCRQQLGEIADFFADGLYVVPKVIDAGQ